MTTGTHQRFVFGMVPVGSDASARVAIADFCKALGNEIDAFIVPHRAPSPLALATAFQRGRVHFAWFSPTLVAMSPALASAAPLVSSIREGLAAYHGVLYVPFESRIRSPADLAGTHVAWVAETSAAGYLFPRATLASSGYDPAKLFASEHFYQSYGAAARAVFEGAADVGAAFAVYHHGDPRLPLLRAGFDGVAEGRVARVISVSGPIPSDVIVASASIPAPVRAAVAAALVRLSSDETTRALVRSLFGVDAFTPCSPGCLRELQQRIAARDGIAAARVAPR